MKKKRLLKTVLSAVLIGGMMLSPFEAKAQTWTGNTPQAGDFYLYNVGAGKFLTSGCWWGTHAAMDYDGMLLTFAGSGNDYTLSTNIAFANCYVGDNAYMDNSSAATWTFTQVSAGKYTMKNGSNYLVFKGGDVANTDNTAPTTDAGYWQIVSRADLINNMRSATPSSPVDASFFMTNPKNRRNWRDGKPYQGTGFNDNGSFNASADGLYTGGCTSVGQWHKTFDNYQALTNLPNGKYQVTVKGFNRLDGGENNTAAYMYANNSTITLPTMGNIGTENAENATRALVDDTYLTSPVTVTVTDGNLRVGVKCDANCGWVTWREFTVKFLSPQLSFAAEELPANGNMTADQWYYIDISVAGNNYKATATNLGNIVYTTDGTILRENESSVTNTFAVSDNNLSATRYYVKSSTANNLLVEAASYVYEVGSATSDYAYVQGGETVTITYANAASNNPSATFAENGTPTITFGGNAVPVTPTSNGFTFTVPTVTAGTDYTLSIPANAFGYAAGNAYNTAQDITIKTPAVFDGSYYLRTDDNKYLSRGSSWGAHAIVDEFGEMVTFATDKDNKTSIRFFDSQAYLKKETANDWDMYTDAGSADYWHVTLANGKYRLSHYESPTLYVKLENGILYRNGESNIVDWTLEDYATRTTRVSAYPSNIIQSVISASGAQTTVANFETYLAGLTETDLTNKIGTAKFAGAEGAWNWNEPNNRDGNQPAYGTNYIEVYQETGTLSQTITGLSAGIYKVTVDAYERIGSSDNSKRVADSSTPDVMLAYLEANGLKTRLTQWHDVHTAAVAAGKSTADNYPNSPADGVSCFNEGYCTNTVYAYVGNSGELTIKLVKPSYIYDNWLLANNFTLTLYSEDLWPALQAALTTYAPYSDVAATDDATGYTTQYNVYAAYTQSASQSDMQTAITYMQNNYANYQWANASIAHPVDVTDGIITDADCTSNDNWNIGLTGRPTESAQDETGTTRTLFYQNVEPDAVRGQTVTIPKTGAYMLKTWVRNVDNNASTYAKMAISNGAYNGAGTYANREDEAAIYGNESTAWTQLSNYFATTSADQQKTIYINLSHGGAGRKAYVSRMALYYIGQSADFIKDGVHKYIGTYATAPALEVTDAAPVVDVTAATFTSGSSAVSFTNPNGLVFVASDGQTSATKNEVIGTTCTSLQLEKGHPFVNPKEFTASSAKYTVAANGELAGSFATLMIPFAASTLAGTAYKLDQGVNLIDGNIYGTAVTAIAANSPVIVTASGNYTGSSVTVPAVASGATFTNGELIGTYTAMDAPANSYVLQNHNNRIAFYLVGSTQPTVNPFRAYIKPQASNVKAISVMFDADGISAAQMKNEELIMNNAEIFNVAGQRLSKPQRGVNIINGKKVIIK